MEVVGLREGLDNILRYWKRVKIATIDQTLSTNFNRSFDHFLISGTYSYLYTYHYKVHSNNEIWISVFKIFTEYMA